MGWQARTRVGFLGRESVDQVGSLRRFRSRLGGEVVLMTGFLLTWDRANDPEGWTATLCDEDGDFVTTDVRWYFVHGHGKNPIEAMQRCHSEATRLGIYGLPDCPAYTCLAPGCGEAGACYCMEHE